MRGGADGQPLCCIVSTSTPSIFLSISFICPSFSALPLTLFFPPVFIFSLTLFHHSLFSSSSLSHPLLSCSRWQRGAAAAAEQKPECEQEMGRGEGGCAKRRRRKEVGVRHMESLVKGPPQRECVCACGCVMNRGGGEAGYNRCPLRQRFDSNRQRRGETDRQISRQTSKMAQRDGFFSHSFLCSRTRNCCQNFSYAPYSCVITLKFHI